MAESQIRFNDGASYEQMMGVWSRFAGNIFLDWLAPAPGLRWIDIGCGNGAFTELLVDRCAPAAVDGVDPSEGQLGFARTRPAARLAKFHQGNAMALPFPDSGFDVATMALVIFFVPDPAKGIAEMVRVLRPGGVAGAYAWDMMGGGFPLEPIYIELRALGVKPPAPPSAEASRMDALLELWTKAGLDAVETREIAVQRSFADFEGFWTTCLKTPGLTAALGALSDSDIGPLKERVRARLPTDAAGRIAYGSRANAVKGRLPG